MPSRSQPAIYARTRVANPTSTRSQSPPNCAPIDIGHVDDGIDRIGLKQLSDRYQRCNTQRLQKLKAGLDQRGGQLIDVLPLLFHLNHPVLPGYVAADLPCGIRNYRPTREAIKSARQLAKSFTLQREPEATPTIKALYIMGSCGSIAQSNHSDIDIWVCVADNDTARNDGLQKKCDQISTWASSLGLDIHFFIMNDAAFRNRERAAMQGEDCGSTQHYLLLDEFYRSGLLLAGCMPVWWLVPVRFEQEYDYFVGQLRQKRFIDDAETLDFGSPHTIPTSEFLSAGIWQLYKSLEAPHKALMKLLLIESYANDQQSLATLSLEFKQALHTGELDDDQLDTYLQIYRRLEAYLLARNENERLELLRRCLYFKTDLRLSNNGGHHPIPNESASHLRSQAARETMATAAVDPRWRSARMANLARGWGWTRPHIATLDQRANWPVDAIRNEHKLLSSELIHSYRLLASLCGHEKLSTDTVGDSSTSTELSLIGRKLYATFERKTDKLLRINQGLITARCLSEATLTYAQDEHGDSHWRIHAGMQNGGQSTNDFMASPSESPVDTLAWSVVNGLMDCSTRLHIADGDHQLTDYEARMLLACLVDNLPTGNPSIDSPHFAKPAETVCHVYIANPGVDPLHAQKTQGVHRVSGRTDPLAYGAGQENLLRSITHISVNSWGEVFCHHHSGERCIDEVIEDYFSFARSDAPLPPRTVICACASKASAITERLQKLFDDIEQHCCPAGEEPGQARYVFESADSLHALEWVDACPRVTRYSHAQQLFGSLADAKTCGALVVDELALRDQPLPVVLRSAETDATESGYRRHQAVRVYYEVKDALADTYVVDTDGALWAAAIPFDNTRTFIIQLSRFISHSVNRHMPEAIMAGKDTVAIDFFRLHASQRGYNSTLIPTECDFSAAYFPVEATGTVGITGSIVWSMDCGDRHYTCDHKPDDVFLEVASQILQQRGSGDNQNYPCYVTDVRVEGTAKQSMRHDLAYKHALEQRLNRALTRLRDDNTKDGEQIQH